MWQPTGAPSDQPTIGQPPIGPTAYPSTDRPPPTRPPTTPPPTQPPATPTAPDQLPARSRPKHLPLILSIVGGVLVLGCIAGAVTATTLGVRAYKRSHTQTTVGLRQPVRDGEFQFTAKKATCGVDQIGTPEDYQEPSGQFCMITLTVKNVGTGPALFADSIQHAYGPADVRYASDTEAGFYANPNPMLLLNEINPGNEVEAIVVYDIPPSSRILRLVVHENPDTRGAIIKIS